MLLENGLVNIIAELKNLKRLMLFFINILKVEVILPLKCYQWRKLWCKIFFEIQNYQKTSNWIKSDSIIITLFPLGFNDNINQEFNMSKLLIFMYFLVKIFQKRKQSWFKKTWKFETKYYSIKEIHFLTLTGSTIGSSNVWCCTSDEFVYSVYSSSTYGYRSQP